MIDDRHAIKDHDRHFMDSLTAKLHGKVVETGLERPFPYLLGSEVVSIYI